MTVVEKLEPSGGDGAGVQPPVNPAAARSPKPAAAALTPVEPLDTRPVPAVQPPVSAAALTPAEKEQWVHEVFREISEKYDLMNDVESFGLHRAWKRALLRAVAATRPARVLDVATGTGDIALALAKRCPDAQVVGFDFSEEMLAVARRRRGELAGAGATGAGVTEATNTSMLASSEASTLDNPEGNPQFICGNAMAMPFDAESFDVAVISFGLRNMPDYQQVLSEMVRVLRPGGLLMCLDVSYPTLPVVKQGFRVYFRHIMPLMGRLITKKPAAYRWLNDSTEAFLNKPALAALMTDCGLTGVRYRSFLLGAAALHSGWVK